jgi:DNA-binding NtrC family response regulator
VWRPHIPGHHAASFGVPKATEDQHAESPHCKPKEASSIATTLRPLRILIVDDEHAIASSLATILRTHGFEANSVYSGYSAIETAFEWLPDVVISDIHMPGINGVDAVLSMARRLPNSKFLLFSGHLPSHETVSRAHQQGLRFVFLPKPVPPQSVVEYLKGCEAELSLERASA